MTSLILTRLIKKNNYDYLLPPFLELEDELLLDPELLEEEPELPDDPELLTEPEFPEDLVDERPTDELPDPERDVLDLLGE